VLATALSNNKVLSELNMDGNQLGKHGKLLFHVLQTLFVFSPSINGSMADQLKLFCTYFYDLGSEAILSVVRRSASTTRHLVVTMKGCDCDIEDPTLFNSMEPTGQYELELSDPYDRMIMIELLRLASLRAGCRFLSLAHRRRSIKAFAPVDLVYARRLTIDLGDSDQSALKRAGGLFKANLRKPVTVTTTAVPWAEDRDRILELLSIITRARRRNNVFNLMTTYPAGADTSVEATAEQERFHMLHFSIDQLLMTLGFNTSLMLVEQAASMLARDPPKMEKELFQRLFGAIIEVAEPDTEDFNYNQFQRLLRDNLGLDITSEELFIETGLFMYFSRENREGFISEGQIVEWLITNYATHNGDNKDTAMTETLVERDSGQPWDPPMEGVVKVDFVQVKLPPSAKESQDHLGLQALISNIKRGETEQDRATIFENSMRNSEVFVDAIQAQLLLDLMSREHHKKWVLELLLPVMINPQQASRLVLRNLNNMELVQLRVKMGSAFNVYLGNPTGHHTFDLSKEEERRAFNKLGRVNNFEKNALKLSTNALLNTSQKGNGDNFRSEGLNGQPTIITEAVFASEILKAGKIHFDYVSTSRPPPNAHVATKGQIDLLLEHLTLKHIKNVQSTTKRPDRFGAQLRQQLLLQQQLLQQQQQQRSAKKLNRTSPRPSPKKNNAADSNLGATTKLNMTMMMTGAIQSEQVSPGVSPKSLSTTGRLFTPIHGNSKQTSPRNMGQENSNNESGRRDFLSDSNNDIFVMTTRRPEKTFELPAFVPPKALYDWWTDYQDTDLDGIEVTKYWGTETTRATLAEQAAINSKLQNARPKRSTEKDSIVSYVFMQLIVLDVRIFNMWITAEQAVHIVDAFPAEYWGKVQVSIKPRQS